MIAEQFGYSEVDVHWIIDGLLLTTEGEMCEIVEVFHADIVDLEMTRDEEEYCL